MFQFFIWAVLLSLSRRMPGGAAHKPARQATGLTPCYGFFAIAKKSYPDDYRDCASLSRGSVNF